MARLILVCNDGEIEETENAEIPEYWSDGRRMFEVFRWSDADNIGIYIEIERLGKDQKQ